MPTYTGNNGNNTINGSNGNDTIYGLGGNDHLFGRGGNDTIWGGTGHDEIEGNDGNDTLHGEDGNDEMSGGTGNDVMNGGAGNDEMSGDGNDDTMTGGTGDDEMSGGTGNDSLSGDANNDTIHGDDGQDFIQGGAGYDILFGGSGNDTMDGGDQDDEMSGGTGNDVMTGGSGNDQMSGDDGNDAISGGSGNDALFGGNGNDTLTGGGGLDLIDGGSGTDTAVYSGSLFDYTIYQLGPLTGVIHNGPGGSGSGADGADLLVWVERLQFSDVTIDLTANNAPFAFNDIAALDEDDVAYSSGSASVLDNDFDFEGDTLTATPGVFAGTYGTLTLNSNGTYNYVLNANAQTIAQGQVAQDSFTYTVSDGSASDTASLVFNITGLNDAPVANPDTDTTGENAAILIDVVANDDDVDNGAVLTVTAASAPAGQGSASVVGNQVQFDPGSDFDYLAVGESADVVVSYDIEDEHGASASSTITITVTGTNDGPVANPDSGTTAENEVLLVDVLANDTDVDNGATLIVIAASAPAGQGTASVVGNQVQFDPGADFDYLADGESAEVVIDYTIEDEHGAQSVSTVTITVEGRDEGAVIIGTDDGETLTGTPGDDTITALGGDDAVFGLDGADLINGGDGIDFLNGDGGNDVVEGGNDDDSLWGGDGNDQLFGQAGNDSLFGENGDDQLSGGEGNDSLTGGDGDDALNGGDGDDSLTDLAGTNGFVGGLGQDEIVAGSADGPQTIDGGDGNDTIRHYYRLAASVITTGTGSDTIELAYADQGTSAIIVTDFTAGAGGDMFRLSGDDGALLGLLTGWDGSSNPFGSGFLRLQQSGADTLLQWDQNGATGGATWETLVVFQNTDADDFTDANFVPGYDPDGSAPAGQTITGTEGDDILIGTIGSDTINALGGFDVVNGGAGADQINGGDGNDSLSGESDNDVIDGGNDDDVLSGGDGNDQLFGQAGNDSLSGEAGDDQLSGGGDNDTLSGGDGDDALDGGDGDDFLADQVGTNSFAGGLGQDEIIAGSADGPQTIDGGDGNDTIRHYYRLAASVITTGTGSDTIELAYADQGSSAIIVTDFTAGAGGDMFRLSGDDGALLGLLIGWDGSSNPFGSGFLRLQQSGADTLLQWDQNGATGGATWETLVVFQNTDADDFTDANFVPGYDPDGSAPAGQTITGTEGDDTLTGTIGDDTINALGGVDFVSGGPGADLINGGDGTDFLNGEDGNDVVEGGNDDDFLSGGDGNDQLFGQAGSDSLFGENGDDQLSGGDGDDSLSDLVGINSFAGGIGNDNIVAGSADGAQTIDGGDGDDTISHYYRLAASVITTGTGSDTIELAYADQGTAAIIVTDFTAGAGGDMFRLLGGDGALLDLLSGWDGSSNPFGSAGFLRLEQSGADTLLQWDQNGTAGGATWETLVVFQNADADDFTEANFVPGYDPDGSAPAGQTITGTEDDDTLTGTIGGDTINALGGVDFVNGGAGADLINGGDGTDFLSGEADNDVIEGGNDDDFLWGGDDDDQLFGQAGNDSLFGENGNDQLSGGDGNDSLFGNDGNDTLDGGDGDDFLSGGLGSDVLTGGAGADLFDFQSALDGPDEITDFISGLDRIQVTADGFGGDLIAGGPVSLVSGTDPTASEATGQFLFDTDDGRLLWDADGTGSGGAVLLVTFSDVPSLAASDFVVI